MAGPHESDGESEDLYDLALYVYRYARRWAVGQSPNPEDALIYDSCITVLNERFAPKRLESASTNSARVDRYTRFGNEPVSNNYRIPVTAEDALVVLHRYARRYTNGRGSYTAALVNTSALKLMGRGISLDETRDADGTIWAADGAGGMYDGLNTEQRSEALSVLRRKPE